MSSPAGNKQWKPFIVRRTRMVREIARCPYCCDGFVLVDVYRPGIVCDLDGPEWEPCPHLALLDAGISAFDPERDGAEILDQRWVTQWLRDEGVRPLSREWPWDELGEF